MWTIAQSLSYSEPFCEIALEIWTIYWGTNINSLTRSTYYNYSVHKISRRCHRTPLPSPLLPDVTSTGSKRKRFAHKSHLLPGCKLANQSQTYSGLLQIWKSHATKQMQVVQYIMEQRNLASLRVLQGRGEPKFHGRFPLKGDKWVIILLALQLINLEKPWRSNQ